MVVVAAGRGTRLGAADKVCLSLGGKPILGHVLDAVERAGSVRDVVVVVGEHTRAAAEELVRAGAYAKVRALVIGGERRQDSVAAGLAVVPDGTEVVLVHDGARPLASPDLFDRCASAARRGGAAIAAMPVSDTVKRVVDGRVVATVPRAGLWAAQTPQGFRRELLQAALDRLASTAGDAPLFTDEAALFEALDLPVEVVAGEAANLKITRPEDLVLAEALLSRGRDESRRTDR